MQRYATLCPQKKPQNHVQWEAFPSQKLLVTVARRFANRSIGPTLDSQRSGVYHYHTSKNAQNDISDPLLIRSCNGFEMEQSLG